MKKGLLSILAGALLVVGCQNYDDQFSALETQINALASTVAGLSQVQSDLASLAGTVGSLASTVNGLGDQIDTAVADGLSDIQTDIDAITTAVADVASSEEVSSLSDAVSSAQDDLTDLLAASSVFTDDVVVTSAQTLDVYLAMGAGLNIVNGNVSIQVTAAMDQAKVQELVNNILTTVKDFTYESKASTIAETTFDNLTGVRSLTITQGGGMRFPNLVSATNVRLNSTYQSTVEVIHFGSLTSVNSFQTDGTANTGGGGGGGSAGPGAPRTSAGGGGSGIVILRVPTAKYSSTTTGSPTVTTDGSDTIIKFTGDGSYTA